ncbi:TonB-dependent receptor [Bacteroides sp.]|uniref:TonB-dependent receptor n=1 Tax=Bacteroides sp. TaxID=29523 RepID=UPI002FCB9622
MRITTLLLMICVFSAYAEKTYSQDAKVSIQMNNVQLDKILNAIESQTSYLFIYNNQVKMDRKASVNAKNQSVAAVLDKLLKGTDIYYKLEGTHIILSKQPIKASEVTSANVSAAQQKSKISGTIVDSKGEAIIGANVRIKGAPIGTITDLDGNFSLEANPKDVLEVTYIGYLKQDVTVGNQKQLRIVLVDDTQTLDEVVVVGFGTQKKVNLTGSVSTVTAKSLASRPVVNVSQALQGLVPGLNFSYDSKGNGGELNQNMKMNIRGGGTIGSGSNSAPLVLIDGMEGDMNALNPQDIENISVLKDAAASSIYGSRAPFGVILITTKKGSAGKATINYNNSFRWTNAINQPRTADSYTYAKYFNRASANAGEGVAFNAERMELIKAYQEGKITTTTVPNPETPTIWDWVGNSNNNWYDIYFGGTAFSQEHSISANGGSEKIQYYLSGNFLDQQGLISFNPDKLQRYAVTAKINAQLLPWAKLNYNAKFIRTDYRKASYLDDNTFYHNIAKRWPTEVHYDPNGNLMSMAKGILMGGEDKTQTDWIYQQAQLELEPIKGWKIFGEINYKIIDSFWHKDVLKVPNYDVKGDAYYDTGAISAVSEAAERTNFFNPNVYSEYQKDFVGGHSLKAMVGFQAELNNYRNLGATRNDIISEDLPTIGSSSGKEKIDKGAYSHWATAGFFARANYDYKGRYLAEVNARYDGTSRFAREKRWNLFPSVSLGWNVARESFMEPYQDVISVLKFRGSWGELGNQNTESLYPYIQLMKFVAADKDSHWLINNQRPNTSNAPDLISALLGWETMRSYNIGVDLGFLNNRLNVSFDYFNRKTINMVGPAPELPYILGASVPKTNNADMVSTGFELDVAWRDHIGKVSYGVHLLLSDDRQKVTNYPNKTGSLDTWRSGQYMGEIWGYVTHGIAKTDQEMKDWLTKVDQSQLGSDWKAGDIMYEDLDGDGIINAGANTIGNPGDRKIIGNSSPRFKYGIDLDASWKGLDVRVFLQGVAKRDYWFSDNMFWGAAGGKWQSGVFVEHLDFFRPEGDEDGANLNAYFPRPSFKNDKNQKAQTRYLQNAAYLRVKNIQIGYTIPERITKKMGVTNFRIFFSGENLFTFSPLPDSFDPETLGTGYGASWGSVGSAKTHPLSRTISTGFSVNF